MNKSQIDFLKKCGLPDEQIESIRIVADLTKGYEPLTFNEIKEMTPEELSKVLSLCWKYGLHRCHTIGIRDVKIDGTTLSYSDENGDPTVYLTSLDQKIDKLGIDGRWGYGLYKKI